VVEEQGQQFYENKLDEFRKRSVSRDNYVQFVRDVNNIISEADSSINELNEEISRKKNKLQSLRNEIGEDSLESLRRKSVGKWNYDVHQLNEKKDEIIEAYETVFERAMVRGDLHDVKMKKVKPILDSLDAEQIRSDVYEQMNELTEKRIENSEERLQGHIENVDTRHQSNFDEIRRQVRDVREAARREAQENGKNLIEFMEKVIARLDQSDVAADDLRKNIDEINTGRAVDDVDLEMERSESDSDQEIGSSDVSSSLEGTKTKKQRIKEELRKFEAGKSEHSTQTELAEAYDVTSGRISQIKEEMDDI
jgi:hypothetical protein